MDTSQESHAHVAPTLPPVRTLSCAQAVRQDRHHLDVVPWAIST